MRLQQHERRGKHDDLQRGDRQEAGNGRAGEDRFRHGDKLRHVVRPENQPAEAGNLEKAKRFEPEQPIHARRAANVRNFRRARQPEYHQQQPVKRAPRDEMP